MSAIVCNTIAQLRARLASSGESPADALSEQHDYFSRVGRLTNSTTCVFPLVKSTADENKPLQGVGLAHKDIFDLPGRSPGLGRDAGSPKPGLSQAWAVEQLERAGATNFGALTMAEDACSATGQTRHLPTPINPLGADMAVGGSSSGSAVAVASGIVFASLGTDTAGSVRIPAMTCGVMGLKTTHGLIPRDGMTILSPSLDSIGVLARSVGDVAELMQVLAPGLRWQNLHSRAAIKVGYWLDDVQMDERVLAVVGRVMRHYGQTHIAPVNHERRASALQEMVMAYEVGQTLRARIANGLACSQVAGLGSYGLMIPNIWWREALRQRPEHLKAFVDDVFGKVDVMMAPLQIDLLPKTSEVYLGNPEFKAAKLLGLHRYCGWVNYLGLPALAIPIGTTPDGLPVSIQLIAKPFNEVQLLALAGQIQNDIYGVHGILPVLKIEGQQP
ncbi:MAG: amidase [Burkholderiaceae bacterium]|nr:amidase [Burkholderiaceae bacterium]MCD8516641.1 amidase [Burkholderiaceae bacterium]MCD8537955.1 amidase [Burkholderiaceae bacterium]MCD8564785.1 amidase [Burkholderiaceae bacterium]